MRKRVPLTVIIILFGILVITMVVAGSFKNPAIIFESNPSNAEVWVQTCTDQGCSKEIKWGNTPLYQMDCSVFPPVYYEVRFTKDGYYDYHSTVTATQDSSSTYVFAKLIPMPPELQKGSIPLKSPVELPDLENLVGQTVTQKPSPDTTQNDQGGNSITGYNPTPAITGKKQGNSGGDNPGTTTNPETTTTPIIPIPLPEFPSSSLPVVIMTGLAGVILLTGRTDNR